jgi:hypothetical protein
MDPDGETRLLVDPAAVARGAGRLLTAALALDDAAEPRRDALDPPGDAFGPGPAAGRLAAVSASAAAALGVALDRLGEVLRTDADRLYQVAMATSAADGRAADRLRGGR